MKFQIAFKVTPFLDNIKVFNIKVENERTKQQSINQSIRASTYGCIHFCKLPSIHQSIITNLNMDFKIRNILILKIIWKKNTF